MSEPVDIYAMFEDAADIGEHMDDVDCWREVAIRLAKRIDAAPPQDALDAKRYRWLRKNGNAFYNCLHYRGVDEKLDQNVDAAIDAALSAQTIPGEI